MSIKSGSITRVFVSIAFIALGLGFAIDAAASLFEGKKEWSELKPLEKRQ